ncbi:T9SS type A sorting domain-containing protein [uncultured Kordia sp.]|uniref:T9SS type A sorting domain-containing protein n=1 Tax=uncultured Kordia sp. TaxID=507699 RepID=UPI00261F490B|nr:T9SS type A sorting domain-containing protein [uncultured Kordia sp.]
MKQINFLLLKMTFMLVFMYSINSYSQILTTRCGEDFHGYGHAHQNCEDDIVVTSTYDEGTIGTVVSGIIYSENGSIRIIPGYSKVRLIPEYNDGQEHTAEAHRTTAGGNGNGGNDGGLGRPTNENELIFSTVSISPNPTKSSTTFSSSSSKIQKYSIYNMYGIKIQEETLEPTLSYSYNFKHLKEGIYLLKVVLENGEQITKSIIKN